MSDVETFAGITQTSCPAACTTTHCVISTVDVCKHPCKSSDEGCGPVTMANRKRALKVIGDEVRAKRDEFPGLTRDSCCDGCKRSGGSLDFCVITGTAFCGNPFHSEAGFAAGERAERTMRARQQIADRERFGSAA